MESPITSFSFAPAMDILVTTHSEQVGLYTWANQLIFGSSDNVISSNKPILASLPRVSSKSVSNMRSDKQPGHTFTSILKHSAVTGDDGNDISSLSSGSMSSITTSDVQHESSGVDADSSSDDTNEFDSKQVSITERDENVLTGKVPVAPKMITLSMLPRSQWLNLIHIDSIKTRNKPIEPPKKPEAAPFFLPTVSGANAGRDPVFDIQSQEEEERIARDAAAAWGGESDDPEEGEAPELPESRIHHSKDMVKASLPEQDLISLLESYRLNKTWKPILQFLKSISPSKLDIQLRSLDLANVGGALASIDAMHEDGDNDNSDLVVTFLSFLADAISTDTDFEFLQALLRAFILIHGDAVAQNERIKHVARIVEEETRHAWTRICNSLNHTQCLVAILGSMHQT